MAFYRRRPRRKPPNISHSLRVQKLISDNGIRASLTSAPMTDGDGESSSEGDLRDLDLEPASELHHLLRPPEPEVCSRILGLAMTEPSLMDPSPFTNFLDDELPLPVSITSDLDFPIDDLLIPSSDEHNNFGSATSARSLHLRLQPPQGGLKSLLVDNGVLPVLLIRSGSAEIHIMDVQANAHTNISFESGLRFAGSEVTQCPIRPFRAPRRERPLPEQSSGDEFCYITRSYTRKQQLLRSAEEKTKQQQPEVTGGNAVSSYAIEKFPEISESSYLELVSDAKSTKITNSAVNQGSSLQIACDLVTPSEAAYDVNLDSNLLCSEQLSDVDDECSEHSTCNEVTLSEIEFELFYQPSQRDSSECLLSVSLETPEDFSERAWKVNGVLNYLRVLVEKSQIIQILESEKKGFEVFNQTGGIYPNRYTFPIILKSCMKFSGIGESKQLHEAAIKMGFECDLYVQNGLISVYCICGEFDSARKMFDFMFIRDVVCWTWLISGYVKGGQFCMALRLFREMDVEPNQCCDDNCLRECVTWEPSYAWAG